MDIIKLYIDNQNNFNFFVHHSALSPIKKILFGLLSFGIIFLFIKYRTFFILLKRNQINFDGAQMGLKDFKIDIKPNYQTIQVAYKLWVELNTRKLGLPIDPENDVIEEIYNSWYEFFRVTRELIKDIPAEKALNKDTKQLISVATKVLNLGVRPHLTKWQARYRSWCDVQKKAGNFGGLPPQKLQKHFSCPEQEFCYGNLINDMLDVNKKLIEYKKLLEEIVFAGEFKD